MKIALVERQPVRVVSRRYTGPFGDPLGRFWRLTMGPWLADHGLLDCPRYGLALDNPRITAPENCRYDACVELPAGLVLPEAAETTIAGGLYAITPFKGTGAQIGAAWEDFAGLVFIDAAHRPDSQRHPLEHYPRGTALDPRTGVFAGELCLPLTN